ncbi:LLM class flavin-dependent oxidoreductase [Corynebacterium lowii]|uniref:Alkanesulfonate monooxygenase n=1 Tax=Corynebacterium lowii TaxID=1544413 RepID=A0A0Q0ZAS9_9CORY|nr:LLM class flavin-dependent oxidoreductase [Corynebacterium lowii]KQB87045.1 Alkanesulfonate monooxygenase [Corynebacterium lowii]MDP9852373.1 alkanesulfonate monooxygenase [Corynebacterium lowii]
MTTTTRNDRDVVLHWFLPTYGDSRGIMSGGHGAGDHRGERAATLDYLTQLALAAEQNGFESVLTPTGQWCEESWLVTAALIARTSRLKFLVALRPGLVSPTIIAQQIKTFQDLSGGRLAVNVVVGGEDHEQRSYGDYLSKEERYRRADEVLQVTDHLLHSSEPLDFHGEHVRVEGAQLRNRPQVVPPVYFGGSSRPGIEVAARRSDVYLTWGEPPEKVAEKIERVRAEAAAVGRAEELEYGIRLHVIARDTEEEAWAEAQRLLDQLDPHTVSAIQAGLARSQSEGQRRMTELHSQGATYSSGADARVLEVSPNLWAGVGLVRGGAGTALVGSHAKVAQRIAEYRDLGLKHFILSGYPHLEEAFAVGEGVVPALHDLGYQVANRPGPADAPSHSASADAERDLAVPFLSR